MSLMFTHQLGELMTFRISIKIFRVKEYIQIFNSHYMFLTGATYRMLDQFIK